MCGHLSRIVHAGSEVFETATVDAIISLFVQQSETLTAYVFNQNKEIEQRGSIIASEIGNPYLIDSLFSPYTYLLRKIDSQTKSILIDLAKCEGACSTGDAYKLVPLIKEENSNASIYRLVNTGTLDKYATRWGYKEIVYLTKELGFRPVSPTVSVELFENTFGKAYRMKAKGPKIIMKGLNLLDAFVDTEGIYLPGKTTLVINSSNIDNFSR